MPPIDAAVVVHQTPNAPEKRFRVTWNHDILECFTCKRPCIHRELTVHAVRALREDYYTDTASDTERVSVIFQWHSRGSLQVIFNFTFDVMNAVQQALQLVPVAEFNVSSVDATSTPSTRVMSELAAVWRNVIAPLSVEVPD